MQQGAHKKGYTLVEILVVVSILGVVALVAIPDFSSNTEKFELATAEVVQAIRFARSEAVHTGEPHGVMVTAAGDRVQVGRLPNPPPALPIYDVRHPVDKKLYDLQFQRDRRLSGIDISKVEFKYAGGLTVPFVVFNRFGVPYSPDSFSGNALMLTKGKIKLKYGDDTRSVEVAPMTGRVTVK